ncbi:MAG: head decoration protein [Steroidobacteraceae bacterium]
MTNIATTRASFQTEGTFTPDNLSAGDYPVRTRKVTIVSGQNLVRGALLGQITTGGKYNLSLSAASDGSQTPRAILAEDIDASGGDKEAVVYISGDFNERAITYGTAHTAATVREGLRDQNIYLHAPVPA